jgi:hypothetical protein
MWMRMPIWLTTRPRAGLPALLLAATVLADVASPAAAQTLLEPPRRRQGYYLSLGLAAAIDHNWQDGANMGTWGGQLISFRLGQLVTRRFGLGLRFDGGGAARGPHKAALAGLAIEGQWELASNLAVHGSVGLGVVSLTDDSDPDHKRRATAGAGYTLWLGYDWFPGRRLTGGFAVTPVAGVRLIPGSSVTALVGLVGVDITYWTGLPREQLQLSPGESW